ncbi:MAG: mechanosensitive ion channel family protein, partial [Idiomarina sp.]|nr:mechanosensitive ion channel family protein [Idiomarina sp.]
VNEIYNRQPDAHEKPIKGYLQIAKIVVYVIATILIIASLLDRSPVILLSGIGAMGAVALLVFQDTLLSLVASIQLSSNDMLRVGDWIEMPQLNADGDVIDVALHTVRVQNWDKTITNIPTKRLISESFKNWRGMQESGGRRIKRSLYIDQNSIHFLSAEQKTKLKRFSLLHEYLEQKEKDISEWNSGLEQKGLDPINGRQVTNIGTFRAYVKQYLKSRPDVHQGLTLMVRQLGPGPQGLPIEVYCFSNDTAWETYEGIQSDIFDHLFAILPQFDLQVYQETSGQDVRMAVQQLNLTGHEPS